MGYILWGNAVSRSGKRRHIRIPMNIFSVVALVFAFLLTATAAEKTTDQLLEEARAAVKSVSIQDVKGIVDHNEKAVLLDIRDMKEFVVDHIRGAENMSRAVGLSPRILEFHMQKIVPNKAARIVVYCEFATKAPLAVKAMNEIGYSNAVYMRGGLKEWKEAGYPLEKK